ncbi:MAG: PA containing protein [Pseudonocardia sp.]|jgi:chromosome segregation ATPase|nr:PA containing protein [Pseudonocardia sp.]
MRSMLVRAAEIRDSEQQQIFDALDEIHARLAPLESLGSVRKRLSEMPDRTEVGVLAARVDQALSKLDGQDSAVAALSRAVESIADKLAKPFAELGGRLDGMAGRFEGVAGRMDGLEDRIAGLHKRIDDMDHHLDRQDAKVDGLPAAVHGPVRDQIGATETGFRSRLDEVDKEVQESLAGAMESLTQRLDTLSNRLNAIEEGVVGRIGSITERLGALDGALAHRPDVDSLFGLIRRANEESELRYTAQLDEAMATFAEIIMGGTGPAALPATSPPPPRPAQRRTRARQAKPAEDAGDAAEGVAS